ncbi:MAG TPA: hypothetical protein VJJ79_00195 [Candidatus Nanoarchaeia archaeon]|nr:hypothetical protein [Candidatus Nanoarchaeia archaeon]
MEDLLTRLMILIYGAGVWSLYGFGKRGEDVAYQFSYHGLEATVVREDIRGRWDNYYLKFPDGNAIIAGNFISDDGKKIYLSSEGYFVKLLEE